MEAPKPEQNSKELQAQAEKLRRLEFNLEIAQALSIHDFFALYLKNKSHEEMTQVITKLDPQELSELLMAYKETLYGVPVSSQKVSEESKKNL